VSEALRQLNWAVKESFLAYVRGLPDGTIESFAGCEAMDGTFAFPCESCDEGVLSFYGGVQLKGFAGMLDVRLAAPMVEGRGTSRKLTALVGPRSIAARVVIATIESADEFRVGEPWVATPKLTYQGVRTFGDVYQVGTELAPLVVVPERS
jgi:hypothetical protein